jgi:GTPase SAR1 family protein
MFYKNGYIKYKKEAEMDIIRRFFQESEQSFFLFGPRGTGKSTWVHQYLPNSFGGDEKTRNGVEEKCIDLVQRLSLALNYIIGGFICLKL